MAAPAKLPHTCAVAALALVARLLLGRDVLRLNFVTCDIMGSPDPELGPCIGDFWRTPWFWTEDFYPSIGQHAREVVARGGVPTIIHVGASEFSGDRKMYRPMLEALPASSRKLVLAEPQKVILDELREHAGELESALTSVHIVNAAVASRCHESIKMYAWSSRLQEAFDRKVPLQGYVSSNPSELPFRIKAASTDTSNVWMNDLRKVKHWTNLSEYVEEITFDCITVHELFQNVSASPSDVVSVVVDAEGEDVNILRSFFQQAGFAPTFFMLETSAAHTPFVHLWRDYLKGYTLGKTALSINVIGLAPGRFAWPWLQLAIWAVSQVAPCSEAFCPSETSLDRALP